MKWKYQGSIVRVMDQCVLVVRMMRKKTGVVDNEEI